MKVYKEEIYSGAIKHWGMELQIGMLMEEIGELMVVINRFRRGRIQDHNKIAEEMADVIIMIEQIAYLFKIDEKIIEEWKSVKLDKLKIMIDKEEK